MRFDLENLATPVVYNLISACVMPRPIAWITTEDKAGRVNAAPYSFFNIMGSDPPTVAVGMLREERRGFKDTARNILETGEFVVNMVPEHLAVPMNMTAIDAPTGVDEVKLAGLTTAPSQFVVPPRIAESPISFECVMLTSLVTGPLQTIVIGRILAVHVDPMLVKNAERGHLLTEELGLIGRTVASGYARTTDRFELDRPIWDERHKAPEPLGTA